MANEFDYIEHLDSRPNSHKVKDVESKEKIQDKKLEKVVNGPVKVKKKSEITKFTDIFFAEDTATVKKYIGSEVIIPAIKKLIKDIVTDGIEILMDGSTGGRKRDRGSVSSGYSYGGFFDRRDDKQRYSGDSRAARYSYDDISIPTRGEAVDVLTRMDECIGRYGIVSVADFYELVGVRGNYTDNKYGWTNLSTAEIVRVRDGYMIRLPKPLPIN